MQSQPIKRNVQVQQNVQGHIVRDDLVPDYVVLMLAMSA